MPNSSGTGLRVECSSSVQCLSTSLLGESNNNRSIGEEVKSRLSDDNSATVDQLNKYIETSDQVVYHI